MNPLQEKFELFSSQVLSDDPFTRWKGYRGLLSLLPHADCDEYSEEVKGYQAALKEMDHPGRDLWNLKRRPVANEISEESLNDGYVFLTWPREDVRKEVEKYSLVFDRYPSVGDFITKLENVLSSREPDSETCTAFRRFLVREITDLQ
jgi:hypothetical protein